MKSNFLILGMVFLLVMACKDEPKSEIESTDVKTEIETNRNKLKGTWELVGFYNYKDNVFGYGSYNYDDGKLTEVLDFGSAFMNEVIKENQKFNFALELSENRFEQIELDEDGNKIYSENYERVE